MILRYFDHAATTPVDPRVLEKMLPYFTERFGNPSSIYRFGQEAKKALTEARDAAAEILGVQSKEIFFTSGGTESNNLFLKGAAHAGSERGRHIITTTIEHDSVLKPLQALEKEGFEVTYLDVGDDGVLNVADVEKALRPETIIVSVMYANNEIGTIQPIAEIGRLLKARPSSLIPQPYFHTDACQAAPYLPLSVRDLGVSAMTLNGGKIYGPKGAGMLFMKEGQPLEAQMLGGGQEYRMRSGTENVPAIVGFGEALTLVQAAREEETKRLLPLRDALIDGLLKTIPHARLNGSRTKRLPNNVNISFKGLEGEAILLRLDMIDVAASAGSACTSGLLEPSHVIRAIGLPEEWSHSSTRFTLGHGNSMEEVKYILEELPKIIKDLREISAFVL